MCSIRKKKDVLHSIYKEELVPVKQIYSNPLKLVKVGDNKLIAEVSWNGTHEGNDEPVLGKFKCFSKAVTVKGSPQVNLWQVNIKEEDVFFLQKIKILNEKNLKARN
ncbi:hypothetical protein C1645_730861 [Glomus cerebriforme]|uniref:Uncharacterized protein n=1 Tax=Glomus cerebriforme TaxID=658196 RepID=A0A397TRZ1_9GLOM|nr:hypothetical protein C1645_730861 [Glomus cerebriforme]